MLVLVQQGWGRKPIEPATTSPWHPNRDGRATDSCFALVVAHQCGAVMEVQDDCLLLQYICHKWNNLSYQPSSGPMQYLAPLCPEASNRPDCSFPFFVSIETTSVSLVTDIR